MSAILLRAGGGALTIPERALEIPDEGAEHVARELWRDTRARRGGLRDRRTGRIIPFLGGGAELNPFEGLDVFLNTVYRKAAPQTGDPTYLRLFTSQTPATVPAQTAVLASSTGVTEATGGGYGPASVAASSWPAAATADTTGRRSSIASPGISFAESTGAYTVTSVNGFMLATAAGPAAGVALFYANFDSGQAIIVNQAGFIVRIPPFAQFTD